MKGRRCVTSQAACAMHSAPACSTGTVTRCDRSLRPDTISAFRQRAHADIQRIRKRVMGRTVETFCGLLFLALACEAQYIQDPIVGSNNPVPVVPNHILMPSIPHINFANYVAPYGSGHPDQNYEQEPGNNTDVSETDNTTDESGNTTAVAEETSNTTAAAEETSNTTAVVKETVNTTTVAEPAVGRTVKDEDDDNEDDKDKDSDEDPLTAENRVVQVTEEETANDTAVAVTAEKTERVMLADHQASHSNLANELQSLHAQMLVALHDPTNYDDVETALNTTVESMTGLEAMNEKEKVDAEKFIHQHVSVNVNRKKSEEDRKRHRLARLSKKEKLYAMATEWKVRCAKWTARLDKARMVLAKAFKGAMRSSKMAQKGCLANQNDHITLAQLKWSKLAINEVKCTFKYLLAVKVNKLKICSWSHKASLSAKTMQMYGMPRLDLRRGIYSDEKLALLSLTNKRATEKTQLARKDAKAIRADYEAKGMGAEKQVKKQIDTDDGSSKDGRETLDMMFERIMGRDMNLTWTKPQHYSNNSTLPNPLENAKQECLGGNCDITRVDVKNDKRVKWLQNRKKTAASPVPRRMPFKRL